MQDIVIKVIGSVLIWIVCIVFGFLPLRLPQFRTNKLLLSLSNCFAGGLFIAIGLIHILPEAHEELEGKNEEQHNVHGEEPFPWSYVLCLLSFSFILLIDKIMFNQADFAEETLDLSSSILNKSINQTTEDNLKELLSSKMKVAVRLSQIENKKEQLIIQEEYIKIEKDNEKQQNNFQTNSIQIQISDSETEKEHKHIQHNHHNHNHAAIKKNDSVLTAYVLLLAMGVHSFFAGVGLGVSSGSDCVNMIIAILAHKWSEALTIGISFVSAEIGVKQGMRYIVFYSFITPLGILGGSYIDQFDNGKLNGIAKALSSGTFLYISCAEIIIEEFSIGKDKYWKFFFYCLGIFFVILLGMLE